MTSFFGFAGEIDFTYGAIDKSDETECGYIKLNSKFCINNHKDKANGIYT